MKVASGHEVEVLEGEELAKQVKDFKGYKDGLVRLNPGGWLYPISFQRFADKFYNFEFRPSDVVIVTYPKCGTTWMQEIVWTMKHNPDFTHPLASLQMLARSPLIEMDMFWSSEANPTKDGAEYPLFQTFQKTCPGKNPQDGICLQMAECLPDPRILKSHLPFSLITPSVLDICKVICMVRNPKDIIVSYHHFCRLVNLAGFQGKWEDFVEYFVKGDVMFGNYGLFMKEAWQKRNHPNMHITFFEDLKADLLGEIKRLDAFLGTKLSPQQLEATAQYTTFKEMKKRDVMILDNVNFMKKDVLTQSGGFFRKGEVGDWKDKFSPEVMAKVDSWIEEHFKPLGLDFKYSA